MPNSHGEVWGFVMSLYILVASRFQGSTKQFSRSFGECTVCIQRASSTWICHAPPLNLSVYLIPSILRILKDPRSSWLRPGPSCCCVNRRILWEVTGSRGF